MSTDYQVLLQKFNNFKEFVGTICKNAKLVGDYSKMTDNEFLLFGMGFLLPNRGKLNEIVRQICAKMQVTDLEQVAKVQRYMECFVDYLDQMNTPENLQGIIKDCATEKNIKTE